jgi:hypothetical protein
MWIRTGLLNMDACFFYPADSAMLIRFVSLMDTPVFERCRVPMKSWNKRSCFPVFFRHKVFPFFYKAGIIAQK